MYWRYSANSTLNPLNGLLCSPDKKPSTIVRAFGSSVPRRATTAGSRNSRSRVFVLMSHRDELTYLPQNPQGLQTFFSLDSVDELSRKRGSDPTCLTRPALAGATRLPALAAH